MKHYETHFDDYMVSSDDNNFYPKMDDMISALPAEVHCLHNLLLYGRPGCGKYTQALRIIRKYSPSGLKYEKKTRITLQKTESVLKISDVHFEMDMSLLGCNAKMLWHEWYNHIVNIIKSRSVNSGIILCKNMQSINNDLLDILYSYIQNNSVHRGVHITFIFLSDGVCFLPSTILNCCEIVGLGQPVASRVKKQIKRYNPSRAGQYNESVSNIKSLYLDTMDKSGTSCTSGGTDTVQDKIMDNMVATVKLGLGALTFLQMRDAIYDLFIYEVNLHEFIWRVLALFIDGGEIDSRNMDDVIQETHKFFHMFNNNYRPIYHMERYLYVLMKMVQSGQVPTGQVPTGQVPTGQSK